MNVKIYTGSHIDVLENIAVTAYAIADADSRAILAVNVQAARPDRSSIDLQAIRNAIKGLSYIQGVTGATIYSDSCQAVSWLRGAQAPKGLRRLTADVRRRAATLPCQVQYQCVCSDTVAVAAQLAEAGNPGRTVPPATMQRELLLPDEV